MLVFFRQKKDILFSRHVARSENLGGRVVLGEDNVPPLVEIGLTDLPKSGGTMAPLAPPGTTGLHYVIAELRHRKIHRRADFHHIAEGVVVLLHRQAWNKLNILNQCK